MQFRTLFSVFPKMVKSVLQSLVVCVHVYDARTFRKAQSQIKLGNNRYQSPPTHFLSLSLSPTFSIRVFVCPPSMAFRVPRRRSDCHQLRPLIAQYSRSLSPSLLITFMFPIQLWVDGLRKITHNVKANNVCPMTCLKKQ